MQRPGDVLASLRSAAVLGVDAFPVIVEVDVSYGLPIFTMVGLPDTSVRESRDRVRTAIRNSGFEFPSHRVTVNLAPADVRKAGASYDLPIALGVLAATGVITGEIVKDIVLLGELSLDGSIQPIRGVLPVAVAARREGKTALLLPRSNAAEARIVEGLRVLAVDSLLEAVNALNHSFEEALASHAASRGVDAATPVPLARPHHDFAEVIGQGMAKRALEIAAAGSHNVLMVGAPGGGKTMMARRVPGILPPLDFEEALECTCVHSVAGALPVGTALMPYRPFRAPHHTISEPAMIGSGTSPRPGEISLAHNGVLFLDELAEFDRRVLEALRQPLEEGVITVSRAARSASFPARFMLIAAMNPCPCGFRGDPRRACRCTDLQVRRYAGKISGPLLDRIDLVVEVPASATAGASGSVSESSKEIAARVAAARARQRERAAAHRGLLNSALTGAQLATHCALDRQGARLLERAVHQFFLSARSTDRLLRVSRTIADLAGAPNVSAVHAAEALQYRCNFA